MARSTVSLSWESKQIEGMVQKALAAGLREAGKHGKKAIQAELAGSEGSPPGGPPGSVTGNLRRAVAYRVRQRKGRFVVVDVGVLRPSRYDSKGKGKSFPGRMHAQAVRLARGYVGRDRLGRVYSQRPRPFVEPVLKREQRKLAQIVETTAGSYMPKAKRQR